MEDKKTQFKAIRIAEQRAYYLVVEDKTENNGVVYYNFDCYSYHQPIARVFENKLYINTFWWNYSTTTRKHYKEFITTWWGCSDNCFNLIKKAIKYKHSEDLDRLVSLGIILEAFIRV